MALLMFHAFTGCDTVSYFGEKGNKTAWKVWMAFNDVKEGFCGLADKPSAINESIFLKSLYFCMTEQIMNIQ